MVAVIKTGHSLNRILNYNEQKVQQGNARCIDAVNYPVDVERLSFSAKLGMLQKQAERNDNVTRNSVHISLNFAPFESFSDEQLREIANNYMQRIGFGEQPFLVYQHLDAGHPHLHIVSLKVRQDGSRIDMHNIGKNQSEKARKEIEKEYELVPAEDHQKINEDRKIPDAQKIIYGRSETKRAIQNALSNVLESYRYASLPELNAVLLQFNISADKGSENSRTFKHRGLVYHLLDKQGNRIGVPIKASAFYNKPTLPFLEEKFKLNEPLKAPHKARVKNAIDLACIRQPNIHLEELIRHLETTGISVAIRQNADGQIYGLTYIDHQTKTVFNGSALGKAYSAKGILERSISATHSDKKTIDSPHKIISPEMPAPITDTTAFTTGKNVLDILLEKDNGSGFVPGQLLGKKRKKKRSRKL